MRNPPNHREFRAPQATKRRPPAGSVPDRRRQFGWPARRTSSDADDVRRVKPLVAALDLELDELSLGEGLEALHRDGGEVDEDVLTPLLLNEAIALGIIEPLHLPSGH